MKSVNNDRCADPSENKSNEPTFFGRWHELNLSSLRFLTEHLLKNRELHCAIIGVVFVTLIVQFFSRCDTTSAMYYVYNFKPLIGGVVVTFSLVWILHFFLNSFRWSLTIVAAALITLSIISATKYKVLQVPLAPSDMLLLGQGANVFSLEMWPMSAGLTLLSAIAIIGLFTLILLKSPRWKMRICRRVSYLFVGTAILCYCISPKSFPEIIEEIAKIGLRPIQEYYPPNSDRNGFLVGFINQSSWFFSSIMHQPDRYQSSEIDRLITEAERNNVASPPARDRTGDELPNLIVVVNESFYDITRTPGLKLSADPLVTFHRCTREGILLNVVSPCYGGETCNAEFELLTGADIAMLSDQGSHPFLNPQDRWPSMASYLKDRGYCTLAIHPGQPNFWNRRVAFPALGFERFISADDMQSYDVSHYKGAGLSDVATINETISRIKSLQRPYFCYTLTIGNHLPYIKQKYETFTAAKRPVEVLNPELADTDRRLELQHYIDGLVMADRSVEKLIKYLEQQETHPTLLVFLGDHRPSLRRNVSWMYKDSADNEVEMHTVPVLVWANYPLSIDATAKQTCDMSAIPGFILRQMGHKLPPMLAVAERFYKEYPIYSSSFIRDRQGNTVSAELLAREKTFQDYQLLQYDIFFGRQHALRSREMITCRRPTGAKLPQ